MGSGSGRAGGHSSRDMGDLTAGDRASGNETAGGRNGLVALKVHVLPDASLEVFDIYSDTKGRALAKRLRELGLVVEERFHTPCG